MVHQLQEHCTANNRERGDRHRQGQNSMDKSKLDLGLNADKAPFCEPVQVLTRNWSRLFNAFLIRPAGSLSIGN